MFLFVPNDSHGKSWYNLTHTASQYFHLQYLFHTVDLLRQQNDSLWELLGELVGVRVCNLNIIQILYNRLMPHFHVIFKNTQIVFI